MEFVYCESYLPLYVALHLHQRGEEVTVLTGRDAVARACEDLGIECLLLPALDSRAGGLTLTIHRNLALRGVRGTIRKLSRKGELHFTHTQYSIPCFLVAKEWAGSGAVHLWDVERVYGDYARDGLLDSKWASGNVRRLLARLMLGLHPLSLRVAGDTPVLSIGEDFLSRYSIDTVRPEIDFETMRARVLQEAHVDVPDVANLLCVQGLLLRPEWIDTASLREVYEFVGRFDAAVKAHPGRPAEMKFFEDWKVYPPHIPGDLLFSHVRNSVVAVHSTLLRDAARVEGLKAVSLLELVHWNCDDARSQARAYLDEGGQQGIHYPRSREELAELLQQGAE